MKGVTLKLEGPPGSHSRVCSAMKTLLKEPSEVLGGYRSIPQNSSSFVAAKSVSVRILTASKTETYSSKESAVAHCCLSTIGLRSI